MPNQRRPGLASVHFYTLPEVKADFAKAVARNGETMTAALTALMRSYTQQPERRKT